MSVYRTVGFLTADPALGHFPLEAIPYSRFADAYRKLGRPDCRPKRWKAVYAGMSETIVRPNYGDMIELALRTIPGNVRVTAFNRFWKRKYRNELDDKGIDELVEHAEGGTRPCRNMEIQVGFTGNRRGVNMVFAKRSIGVFCHTVELGVRDTTTNSPVYTIEIPDALRFNMVDGIYIPEDEATRQAIYTQSTVNRVESRPTSNRPSRAPASSHP